MVRVPSGQRLIDTDATPPSSWNELRCVYQLDVAPSKEPGKHRGDIEFAALCQTRQVCDRALPINKQKYPAFPARELSGKRGGWYAGYNLEHSRCSERAVLGSKFHPHSSPPAIGMNVIMR